MLNAGKHLNEINEMLPCVQHDNASIVASALANGYSLLGLDALMSDVRSWYSRILTFCRSQNAASSAPAVVSSSDCVA